VEFVVTELTTTVPGLLSLGTTKYNSALDVGDNANGEYILGLRGCFPAGEIPYVRRNYGDYQGVLGNDVIVKVRGLQPGDSQPSTFDGQCGYSTCDNQPKILALEPWPASLDYIDPTKDIDTDSADGVCVLNALIVPNETSSIGQMKARF
jgi:hypothetical protein